MRPSLILRRPESRALALLFVAAGAIWAFLAIGGEMREGETLALDRRLLLLLRTPSDPARPIGPPPFREAMRDVTALGGFTALTLVTLGAGLAFWLHRRRRHAVVLTATVLIAQFLSQGLKTLYGRPRPDLVPREVYVYSASFPSGHSMLSAATYLTLAVLLASLETRPANKFLPFVFAGGLMLAVGFSRIYLAVHWPSDVLAGWCAGAACAAPAWTVLLRTARPGEARDPSQDL